MMADNEGNIVVEEEVTETKEAVAKVNIENIDAKDLEDSGEGELGNENVHNEHLKTNEIEKSIEIQELKREENLSKKEISREYVKNENVEEKQQKSITEEESKQSLVGEYLDEEHITEEQKVKEEEKKEKESVVEEEELKDESLNPPDPTAPLNLTDSKELMREPFELRPDQIAEIDQLWEVFQDYTPAYTDIQGYITEVELAYMLKALLLMTCTPEQMKELIEFCVRPPHPQGHINYEQFLQIVTLRQRDYGIEDELKDALKVLDPNKTGKINRDFFIHVVGELGEKMAPKVLNKFVAEVDMNNDGELGFEDIYGTMCNDLGQEDIERLKKALITPAKEEVEEEEDSI